MKRIALAIVMILCCIAAAQAAEKIDPALRDKGSQEIEPWFTAFPGDHLLADVPESEPGNDVCPGQGIACGDVVRPAAVTAGNLDHYSFTANAGDVLTIGTEADGTPTVDTFIHLFNADCTSQLATDDDGGPGLYSLITFCAPATGTYVVRVRGFSATGAGLYKLTVTCTNSGGYGDDCAHATPVPCGAVDLSGSTSCSVNDYTLPAANPCTGFVANGRDVVLQVTVEATGILNLTYTSSTDASIYLVDACAPINCLAGADDTVSGQPEVLSYNFSAAGTYYIILDSFGTNTGGSWTLTGDVDCGVVGVEPAQWSNVKSIYR